MKKLKIDRNLKDYRKHLTTGLVVLGITVLGTYLLWPSHAATLPVRGIDPNYVPTGYSVTIKPTDNLASVISANPAGTTFAIQAGTYRLTSPLTVPAGDTLLGYPGVIISGSKDISTGWTSDGAGHWYVGGQTALTLWSLVSPDGIPICGTNSSCENNQDVYFDKTFMQPAGSLSALITGKFYFDSTTGRIYIGTNPAGHLIETTAFTYNRDQNGNGNYAYTGIVQGSNINLRNITFEEGGGGWNPNLYLNGGTMTNCVTRLNSTQGVAGNGTVLNSIITHNGQLGVSGGFSLLDNDEISYNNEMGFDYAWEAGGGKYAAPVSNTTISNTWSHDNYNAPGWWYDYAGSGNKITNSTFENNGTSGVMVEQTPGVTITNNIFRGNGTIENTWPANYLNWWVYGVGLGLQMTSNSTISGNYSYDNVAGPMLLWNDEGRGSNVGTVLSNVSVHDNYLGFTGTPNNNVGYSTTYSLMQHNSKTGTMCASCSLPAGTSSYVNNHYYAEPGSAGSAATWFTWGTTSQSFASWQAGGRDTSGSITAGAFPTPPSTVGGPSSGDVSTSIHAVTGVNASSGPQAGGNSVTISGSLFASGATVKFGTAAATNVVFTDASTLTATVPPGTGTVDVSVTSGGVSATLSGGYTYTPPPKPYGGTPPTISNTTATKLEAENYDQGGEGVGYHDGSASCNAGGSTYRGSDCVGIKDTTTYSNGHAVGYYDNGDWLSYTVSVPTAGTYTLGVHDDTIISDGTVAVSVDGNNEGTITAARTADWSTFADSPPVSLTLSAGTRVIRLTATGSTEGYFGDVDYLMLTPLSVTPPPTTLTGDINGDGHVNTLDLSIILSHDGQNYAPADLNHDGTVGAADLAILLSHWLW